MTENMNKLKILLDAQINKLKLPVDDAKQIKKKIVKKADAVIDKQTVYKPFKLKREIKRKLIG